MPAQTVDFRTILEKTETLYEAVMVIAKRARQINEEMYQKKRDRQILEELEGGFDEDFIHAEHEEHEASSSGLDEEENPIVHSQREFMENQLNYNYDSRR